MSKIEKYLRPALSALLFLGAFLFFVLGYWGHLHLREQLLLFQFTWDHFFQIASCPGGFADWCGRFLTQFCYWSAAGAAIAAALVLAVQRLCWRLSDNKSSLGFALSFIPAIMLWLVQCQEYGTFGFAAALIITLSATLAIKEMKDGTSRNAAFLVLIPVLYLLCGPVAVLFVICAGRFQKPALWPAAIVLAAACPLVAQFIFPYRLRSLTRGILYLFDPEIFPKWEWLTILSAAAFALAFSFIRNAGGKRPIAGYVAMAVIAAATPFAISASKEDSVEEESRYSQLLRIQDWDGILKMSQTATPGNPFVMCAINCALSEKGLLPERMFRYQQLGTEGLLPSFTKFHDQPVFAAEAYYHLGMTNTCQRFFFEAQEAIPDMHKGARYYQRLAVTNAINEDYAVSLKYRDALLTTLFYKKWARNFNPDSPEIQEMRELRFHNIKGPFIQDQLAGTLGQLYLENRSNKKAYHYAMAIFLLDKDMVNFLKALGMEKYEVIPKAYQEAFTMLYVERNHTLDGLPAGVEQKCADRFMEFANGLNSGKTPEYMQKHFGDTYWFYYYYVNIQEQ